MEFLPWRTVDLDGAFRVTAPESIAQEVIQEVSNAVTFRFRGDLSDVRLEILLTPPWGWEECLLPHEQEDPPAQFLCRLISRSTGRRTVISLEPDGLGLWFAETSYTPLLDGEEVRAEALLVRTREPEAAIDGYGCIRGQILGRSRIHTVRFSGRTRSTEPLLHLRWETFPTGSCHQLFRILPGEPPTIELNAAVSSPLRRLLMSRSRRRNGGALLRDALFSSICATVWPVLVSTALHELEGIITADPGAASEESIDQLGPWQRRLLALFGAGLAGVDLEPHAALPHLAVELKRPGGFTALMLRLPPLIQQETRLVRLAEAMAEGAHLPLEADPGGTASDISPETRVEVA
jgi:hypothetical protein